MNSACNQIFKKTFKQSHPAGFTLIELLAVVGIISLLALISLAGYAKFIGPAARISATKSTLQTLQAHIAQRVDEIGRLNVSNQGATINAKELNGYPDKQAGIILAKKRNMISFLPQRFEDLLGPDGLPGQANTGTISCKYTDPFTDLQVATTIPNIIELGNGNNDDPPLGVALGQMLKATSSPIDLTKHDRVTESAELLYLILTKGEVLGVESVDAGEFNNRQLRDTDGDGLMEIVDSWGKPVRFYRWPTRLTRPRGMTYSVSGQNEILTLGIANENNILLTVMNAKLDDITLNRDSDDEANRLKLLLERLDDSIITNLCNTPSYPISYSHAARFHHFERRYHTLATYSTPLIVSPGPDGKLGLYEPFMDSNNNDNDPTNDQLGILAQPLSDAIINDPNNSVLNDNVTNLRLEN